MSNGTPYNIRSILGLKKNLSVGFYITDFIFRKILMQNSGVKWHIHHTSTIHCPEKIIRGKEVYPGDSPGVYINATNGLTIGDYTAIAPNVGIISANHDLINNELHLASDPIKIGSFCWLGMGAIILPGVKLGDFTIVGAGAIVNNSFPSGYCVIAGNPAMTILHLNKEQCDTFAQSKK